MGTIANCHAAQSVELCLFDRLLHGFMCDHVPHAVITVPHCRSIFIPDHINRGNRVLDALLDAVIIHLQTPDTVGFNSPQIAGDQYIGAGQGIVFRNPDFAKYYLHKVVHCLYR